MKILYVDLCLEYVNPTRKNVVTLLSEIGDLTIYGPGYQGRDTLSEGIGKFYKKNKYDFVVINEALIFYLHVGYKATSSKTFEIYHKNYYFQFDTKILKDFFNDCISFLESDFDSEKAVFLLESDYYNFTSTQIESLKQYDGYMVGWGKEFLDYHENLVDLDKEVFAPKANDNYLTFIDNHSKIIATPHFVAASEFHYGELENRKYDVNVMGAKYYMRNKVLNVLRNSRFRMHKNRSKYIFRFLSRLKFNPYANYLAMKFYNNSFYKVLIESKSVYTDGSRLKWPIRKYFEIPSAGALLLTDEINGFQALGFKDEHNCFVVDEHSILKRLKYIKENPDIAQRVASEGQKLIRDTHSLNARTRQIGECFRLILDSNFKGSYWENGEFCVK